MITTHYPPNHSSPPLFLSIYTISELQANTSALWANVKGKVVELLVKDEAMASDVTHLLSNVTALNDSLHGHAQALTLLTTSHDQLALDSATQISDTATQIHTKMDTATEGLSRRADTMDGALGQLDRRLEVSITQVGDNITAVDQAAQAAEVHFDLSCTRPEVDEQSADALSRWAADQRLDCILTPKLPQGPTRRAVLSAVSENGLSCVELARDYDQAVWPHAKAGFFGLKKKIPSVIAELGLL